MVTQQYVYHLKRSEGHLDSDTYAFDFCLHQHIYRFTENVQRIWSYAFSEMVNNVMDHSEAEHLKIVVQQSYLHTDVLIIDDGIGIFEKIRAYFSLPTLDDAICELFKGKLTTDAVNHSGEGIFFTSRMMDDFLILSKGKIFATSKYENDKIVGLDEDFSGTCVAMGLSNFTKKQAKEVFDLYSNADGGFHKTRIPLKNIFDTAPVSRSQAKRICNRLDGFKEVVIDFEGLDWMGQGFAHQLFVVYKHANPNTVIIPINMNESVTSMYIHVINSI